MEKFRELLNTTRVTSETMGDLSAVLDVVTSIDKMACTPFESDMLRILWYMYHRAIPSSIARCACDIYERYNYPLVHMLHACYCYNYFLCGHTNDPDPYDNAISLGYDLASVFKARLYAESKDVGVMGEGIIMLEELAFIRHNWYACRVLACGYASGFSARAFILKHLLMTSQTEVEQQYSLQQVKTAAWDYLVPFGTWKPDPYVHQWVCQSVHLEMQTALLVLKRHNVDRNIATMIVSYICTGRESVDLGSTWAEYIGQIKHFY